MTSLRPGSRCVWFTLALGACAITPDESKTGTLGNGVFTYDCINTQDPYCPNAAALDQQPFPSAIAFGGRFNLTYTPNDLNTYPNVSVQAVSSDWFVNQGSVFGALRVGTPWFVAFAQDGRVLDITSITVQPIASVQVSDTTGAGSVAVAGTTHTFGATAEGALGQPLAGNVLYSWASSDPSILAIQNPGGQATPSSTVSVLLANGGTATLTAWSASSQGSITVNVTKVGP